MNLIIYIPQDIKLELNNGTFTLKKGSVITFPDGTQYQLTVDKAQSGAVFGGIGKVLVCCSPNGNLRFRDLTKCVSGAGVTTISGFAYDTTTNKIGYYNSTGVLQYDDNSMPIAIVSTGSDGKIASIDKVFNGFGYIGSTVFALPGVEANIPNGRDLQGGLSFSSLKINSLLINNNYNGGYAYLESSNNIISRIITSENEISYNDIANAFVGANKVMFYYNYSLFDEVQEIDVIKASSSSISQYANSKKFMNLYNELSYVFSNAKTLEDWYRVVFNLKTATGYGLDIWGNILNQGRQFSYDDNGTTVYVFLGGEQTIDGITYSAEYMEEMYRMVLFLKALTYITNCTLASLNSLLQYYFKDRIDPENNQNIYVINYGTMEIRYVFQFYVSNIEKSIFTSDVMPRPTGVLANFEFVPYGEYFGFFVDGIADPEDQPFTPFDNKPFYR